MSGASQFDRIALQRADGRCECEGECGRPHRFGVHTRCPNYHGRPAVYGVDKTVTLTIQHLDGDDRNLADDNLIAMCGACTKRHRVNVKEQAAKRAERARVEALHAPLFDLPDIPAEAGNGLTL